MKKLGITKYGVALIITSSSLCGVSLLQLYASSTLNHELYDACAPTHYFMAVSQNHIRNLELGSYLDNELMHYIRDLVGKDNGEDDVVAKSTILMVTSSSNRFLLNHVVAFGALAKNQNADIALVLSPPISPRLDSIPVQFSMTLSSLTGIAVGTEYEMFLSAPAQEYYLILVLSREGRIVFVSDQATPCRVKEFVEWAAEDREE